MVGCVPLTCLARVHKCKTRGRGMHDTQVPTPLRNMIGRSFATEDAHDQIRAAVVDLFEIREMCQTAEMDKVCTIFGSVYHCGGRYAVYMYYMSGFGSKHPRISAGLLRCDSQQAVFLSPFFAT